MAKIIATSKVFQDGRIVIPAEVREMLGIIKEDDTIMWMLDAERIYVMSSKGAVEEVQFMKPVWRPYEEKLKKEEKDVHAVSDGE